MSVTKMGAVEVENKRPAATEHPETSEAGQVAEHIWLSPAEEKRLLRKIDLQYVYSQGQSCMLIACQPATCDVHPLLASVPRQDLAWLYRDHGDHPRCGELFSLSLSREIDCDSIWRVPSTPGCQASSMLDSWSPVPWPPQRL